MCLAISNNLLLVLLPQNAFFLITHDLLVSQKKDTKTLFSHPPSPFHGNFSQLQQYWHLYCFEIRYTQREATPTQKSARKCAATSCAKDYKEHSL